MRSSRLQFVERELKAVERVRRARRTGIALRENRVTGYTPVRAACGPSQRRRFDGQPSLSEHCGHGPLFIAQRSVASDQDDIQRSATRSPHRQSPARSAAGSDRAPWRSSGLSHVSNERRVAHCLRQMEDTVAPEEKVGQYYLRGAPRCARPPLSWQGLS